jgi:GT2 family glycosyltransferase
MNGNVVLIPRNVAEKVGNISGDYTHSMGDFDYGLRAAKLGCTLWISPGYIGSCRRNNPKNTWLDPSLPFHDWARKVFSLKGLPLGDYRRFAQAHGGLLWPLFWLTPYIRVGLMRLVRRPAK